MLVEIGKLNKKEVGVVSSLDVAETFEKRHADVMRDIREIGCSEDFNERNFALISYKDGINRSQNMYHMTKDGFTLLAMGYTGDKAMKFKEAYIKQFNSMEKALSGKLIEREKGIAIRQSLTKALQQSTENDRMHGHAYSTYTNCIYETLFGMNANQLRKQYGLDKSQNIRDVLTTEELKAVQSIEMLVSGLVAVGWGYDQIKQFVQDNALKQVA